MNVLFLAGVSPETAKSDMLNKILKNHFTYLALDKRVKVVTVWTFINYSVDVDYTMKRIEIDLMPDKVLYCIHFEITADPCKLIGSHVINSQIILFSALKYICSQSRDSCSKSHHSCFKSHYFYSISRHFCLKYKMSCKSLFVSAPVHHTGDLTDKILVLPL